MMKINMYLQLLCIGILCLIQCSTQQEPTDGPYQKAAVTTDVGQCSTMGKAILQRNGSAVDAAITSVLCVGVVNPQSSGIGGGLSMVVYSHDTQEAEALIALEKAPLAATPEMFTSRDDSKYGVKSIAIPGEVQGLWAAHQRYGKLPWSELFDPVIEMAENGFKVTKHLPYVVRILDDDYPFLREMYSRDNGDSLETGDTIRAPELAATLRKIADNGPKEFYNGSITTDVLEDLQANPDNIITLQDFTSFDVEWRNVTNTTFKNNLKMYSAPLTTSGPVLQYILNVLDEYDISREDFRRYRRKYRLYHRFLEAGKFAFALRSHLGDDPQSTTVQNILMALSSKEFAKDTASGINDKKVTFKDRKDYDISGDISMLEKRDDDGEEELLGDTSHVSVLAENGDAVSVTTSVGYFFGSRFYSEKTGVFLNNHMANYYFPARESSSSRIWSWPTANGIAPGRRYLTTTCPNVLVDHEGSVKMVVGASGGSRIISTNAWVILRTLWMGANLKDVVDEKRIANFLPSSNSAYYEKGFSKKLSKKLKKMGHLVKESPSYAVSQTILRTQNGDLDAYSDSRKGGLADGY